MRISWLVCALAGPAIARAQPTPPPERAEAERACAAREPTCDWLATLGSLERQSVDRAIKARGYVVEPAPWGKTIGAVQVYNEDVFAEQFPSSTWPSRLVAGFQRFANNLHYTTRESATYGELVIHEGDLWDQSKVEESARLLRDPLYSSVAVTLPVKSNEPGKVDLLVVTRDIWSLRLNTNYTFQVGKLTNLSFSLSENNFLGHRNVLALAFTMDQGAIAAGPLFIDKNVLGKHVSLSARVDDILTRDDLLQHGRFHNEGSDSTITLSRPLWSLASEWSASATFTHKFSVIRQFQGTSLRPYDDRDTTAVEAIPTQYEFRRWGTSVQATRQFGTDIKHQVSLGYELNDQRPSFLPDFPGTAAVGEFGDRALREAFARDVFPHSELTSSPYVAYTLYTPTYRTVQNVGTYDLVEDFRSGPKLDASLVSSLRTLGSDRHFTRPTLGLSYTLPWCHDGYVSGGATIAGRYQDGTWIDNNASGSLRVVTPSCWLGRIVAQAVVGTRWHDTTNAFVAIGGDPSLRAFTVNQFAVRAGATSSRLLSAQVEARSRPYPWWVFRLGGVLFYDLGGVGESLGTTVLHHDVGVGFRVLFPQTSRELFRFDLPIALDGANRGHPRFIASFESAF